nr:hypothetical protein [Tanacetum cinerariifolium]
MVKAVMKAAAVGYGRGGARLEMEWGGGVDGGSGSGVGGHGGGDERGEWRLGDRDSGDDVVVNDDDGDDGSVVMMMVIRWWFGCGGGDRGEGEDDGGVG